MQGNLESLIDQMRSVDSLEALNDKIVGLRDTLEVEHVVYHSVNSTGEQYAALTYSDEWVDKYISEGFMRIDPVVQGCYGRFHPVDWKNLDWSGKAVRAFREEAAGAGVGGQGYSVPIRGPNGQFALFTVSHTCDDVEWARFTTEKVRELILSAHYVNQKALELERGTDKVTTRHLSPRETDALTMLAMGYRRGQAADSLSISEHTLRVYIESAPFKLNALNTTHAVARAMAMGLLVV